MHFGERPGVCPAGGTHDGSESGDYAHPQNVNPKGKPLGWLWCAKCEGPAFWGNYDVTNAGPCPAGGVHSKDDSGMDSLRLVG